MAKQEIINARTAKTCAEKCCSIEAVISVDERGQMVLPKDIREKAGIKSGTKLALVTWEKNGKVCCMTLMKTEDFAKATEDTLRPVMGSIL